MDNVLDVDLSPVVSLQEDVLEQLESVETSISKLQQQQQLFFDFIVVVCCILIFLLVVKLVYGFFK